MTPPLQKFVDSLPLLDKAEPLRREKNFDYYEITMDEVIQKLHRDLPSTRLWGYNGTFPGPVIEVERNRPIQVKWLNQLPDEHFLPIDRSFMEEGLPEVRTVVHLHGSETRADSDGYPDAWYTRNFSETGPLFEREIYEYPNHQRATTLWYHDHAMYITRLNVYAGLVGLYIIRDKEERALRLPSGDYEIPLVIVDRSLNNDGSLFYPAQPDEASESLPNPSVLPFFAGDTILVNGKIWPYLEVEPRKYRFRILNAANSRTFNLFFDNDMSIYQIGSDGGFLQETVPLKCLTVMPAERLDVIVDFSEWEGETILLKNDLGPNAEPDDPTDDIMQFRVTKPLIGADKSRLPRFLSNIPDLKNNQIQAVRQLKLSGSEDQFGRPLLLLNNKKWDDPITEKPRLGDTELWSFINTTNFPHPMHIHLIQFQVVDRRPFDLAHFEKTGEIIFTGPAILPAANERGWKDTVSAPGGQITRVIVRFAPYSGLYVWHCHILEHEDYEMMRPLEVIVEKKKRRK